MKKFIPIITILVIGVIVFFVYLNQMALAPSEMVSPSPSASSGQVASSIFDKARITKKPFGIYITSQNSPIQPTEILGPAEARSQETTPREKFSGYHTGVDFETTTAEADIDVAVPTFCDGKLLMKKYITGYGGVAAQSCMLNSLAVTVIYGHLRLASITPTIGQQLKKGDTIGVLGKGYSTETDGERKHLHLGIHIGSTINILGYVQKQSDLSGWLDPALNKQ